MVAFENYEEFEICMDGNAQEMLDLLKSDKSPVTFKHGQGRYFFRSKTNPRFDWIVYGAPDGVLHDDEMHRGARRGFFGQGSPLTAVLDCMPPEEDLTIDDFKPLKEICDFLKKQGRSFYVSACYVSGAEPQIVYGQGFEEFVDEQFRQDFPNLF